MSEKQQLTKALKIGYLVGFQSFAEKRFFPYFAIQSSNFFIALATGSQVAVKYHAKGT